MSVSSSAPRKKPQGLIEQSLFGAIALCVWLSVAIISSVLIEWVGIVARWWGPTHAATLLHTELGFLPTFDGYPLITPSVVLPHTIAEMDARVRPVIHTIAVRVESTTLMVFAIAAFNTAKLILLRLLITTLSIPGFVFVAVAAVLDGLVERDIRKFTGGHESSYLFHKAKRWIVPSIAGMVALYLINPWAIHPVFIFGPSMLLFGVAVFVSVSRFKKFI